jgi:Sulfotransferase domain
MVTLPKFLRKWRKRRLRKSGSESEGDCSIGIFVSYPKSGRTWLRVIFDELGVRLKYTHDGMGASKLHPFVKRNHCTRRSYKKKPVVFLTRDPRDTVVSAYFHQKLRMCDYDNAMSEFIRDPLHGVEKIVRYNLTWLERGPRLPAFLPITYEQTSDNCFSVVRKVVDFLGCELRDTDIERIVAGNTFDKMHERESGGEYRQRYDWAISPGDPDNPESFKTRRGKSGGFVDYLSVVDIIYCDEILNRYKYYERIKEVIG